MSREYEVLLPLVVHTREGGSYEQHETFSTTFTEDEETANVQSGLLAIVPIRYRVIGGSTVHGAAPGEEFELGLPLGQEALLIQGGHIERAQTPTKPTKPPRKGI